MAQTGDAAGLAAPPKVPELRQLQPFSDRWREAFREQGLRVHRDSGDTAALVLCPPHRDEEFAGNPAAHGEGERGGDCERCRHQPLCGALARPARPAI